jgi:hypothetical protein
MQTNAMDNTLLDSSFLTALIGQKGRERRAEMRLQAG